MELQVIQNKIYEIRGLKVMLDYDLAELYDVETKALNQAVKRNKERFPERFMFRLSAKEWQSMRSQIVTASSQQKRNIKITPYAFTEHGVTMLASVLKSKKAIKMNILIVEAFIALKQFAFQYKELAEIIKTLEKKYDRQFTDIYEALDLLLSTHHDEKESEEQWKKRKRIGFKVKEKAIEYGKAKIRG
jgi:hypothetical protein